MSVLVETADVERFRSIVARRLGLHFDGERADFLAGVLRRRLATYREPCDTYLNRLALGTLPDEIAALGSELTVNETYFFRNIEQFRALADVVLPERLPAQASPRQLRVLSAGCASGEEAYTLAMVVRQRVPDESRNVSIVGIDIDPTMLRRARRASYSAWALRETPAEMRRRWFHPEGHGVVLDDEIRRCVRFAHRNLADDDPELWRPETYDVIFCRNVLMYLTPGAMRAVLDRLTLSLAPGGYLFLGHAETLRGHSDDFHVRHTHGTFYYQRVDQLTPTGAWTPAHATKLRAGRSGTRDWAADIGAASERIRALDEARRPTRPTDSTDAATAPDTAGQDTAGRDTAGRDSSAGWRLALELFAGERFAQALRVVESLPPGDSERPDALVLRAVLLTHSGRLDRAEEICRRLLELDGLNAVAHHLMASCRETDGDGRAAVDHYRAAASLDPGFAMPRLRLGLLARQRGDGETARRELRRALMLLSREEPQRLLLFGGGFTREALATLCRTELVACGGTP